jgi:hypothetical protein
MANTLFDIVELGEAKNLIQIRVGVGVECDAIPPRQGSTDCFVAYMSEFVDE